PLCLIFLLFLFYLRFCDISGGLTLYRFTIGIRIVNRRDGSQVSAHRTWQIAAGPTPARAQLEVIDLILQVFEKAFFRDDPGSRQGWEITPAISWVDQGRRIGPHAAREVALP